MVRARLFSLGGVSGTRVVPIGKPNSGQKWRFCGYGRVQIKNHTKRTLPRRGERCVPSENATEEAHANSL